MKNKDAFTLFFSRENKQLLGRRYLNLWITCGIFLIAILSVGFGAASMDYLKRKMSDPFVTFVDIVVSQYRAKEYKDLHKFVEQNCGYLGYNSYEPVHRLYDIFINNENKKKQLDGRTLSMNSVLKNATILSPENVICVREDTIADTDFGIILSLDGLEHLGMKDEQPAFLNRYIKKNNQDNSFAVPVLAIVRRLPDMCDFIATDSYAQHQIADESDHYDIADQKYNKSLHIIIKSTDAETVKNIVASAARISNEEPSFDSWDNYNYSKFDITYSDADSCREQLFDSLFVALNKQVGYTYRMYPFEYDPNNKAYHEPALISCYFINDSLQYKVQQFSKMLDAETGYKIDMSKIENLKNLDRVQQMGMALSSIIIFIVIIFIGVFIYFLLNTHFQKIQRNIGTFKAFGVSDNMIYGVYSLIISSLIVSAYAISFAVSIALSEIINRYIPLADEKGVYSRFDCLVWQNGIILILAITLAIVATIYVIHNQLRHTPGDLIYNRNQK